MRGLALLVILVAVSFGAAAIEVATGLPASAATGYNGEYEACNAVWEFHVAASRQNVSSQPAWHHAWHAAGEADPGLRFAIRRYLVTGTPRAWRVVNRDCGFAQN